jgi:hypothetical protein
MICFAILTVWRRNMSETPQTPKSSLDKDSDNHLEEWKGARATLQFFDDKLHDLRKHGFSFLTGLFAAGSILSEIVPEATSGSAITPEKVKLGVFIVTLMLIVALHLLDRNYRLFQQAAFTRAMVLERKLNLELSEAISMRHRSSKISSSVLAVYFLFAGGVALLGGFILYPDWSLIRWLGAALIVAVAFIIAQRRNLKPRWRVEAFKEDWTVSPLRCTREELIGITWNNLSGEVPGKFKPQDGKIFEIKDENGKVVSTREAPDNLEVYDNHMWVVKPADFTNHGEKGTYTLWPRGWPAPLPIGITVHE